MTVLLIATIYTILVVSYLLLFLFIGYTVYAMVRGAPFVPTALGNVRKIIAIADLHREDTLMDLGSGDGRILKRAAPYVREAIGVEINPLLYWWSRWRLKKYKNINIVREDLWKVDLSNVHVLTLFFISTKMEALKRKIMSEMPEGSKVVSYGFTFPNWKYVRNDGKVYLYIVSK